MFAITLEVLTYTWLFVAKRKNGRPVTLFTRPKTWTFQRVPSADVSTRAQELRRPSACPTYRRPPER